ncbi:unnamed protein product [Closterium sp. Yama58-4]|nr:unnamed protein product [Closterium sp. Yama58-4]
MVPLIRIPLLNTTRSCNTSSFVTATGRMQSGERMKHSAFSQVGTPLPDGDTQTPSSLSASSAPAHLKPQPPSSNLEGWEIAPNRRLVGGATEALTAEWTEQEVKNAFVAMANIMSPGSDGLPKELYEAHWDLLGGSFMAMARDFESSASLPAEIKEAVTILLHRKGDRDQLNNYRPITLLNFAYKVLARVVADRMKSNGNKDWYLLLIDFQKAFDSVFRDFLF